MTSPIQDHHRYNVQKPNIKNIDKLFSDYETCTMMTKIFSIYSDTIFGYLQPFHFLNCLAHFREKAKLLRLTQGQKSISSVIQEPHLSDSL